MTSDSTPMKLVQEARRVVVKVGTSVLTTSTHQLDEKRIGQLVEDLVLLRKTGKEVILVTSGAIGAGLGLLGWADRSRELSRSQAAAAVGQGLLMQIYAENFRNHGIHVAQILLTREDLTHRQRYLNARQTMRVLLQEGVLPIVNENDTVSAEEIRFGDNDELSALTAHLMDAQLLVLLTDVDGFERRIDGKRWELIPLVTRITPELERSAGPAGRSTSTGGMVSKLRAAKMVTTSGIPMLLANGTRPGILATLLVEGHLSGTLFLPSGDKRMQARKRWLAYTAKPKGNLFVDAGAREALVARGKSLLASGVRKVTGSFRRGDLVSVRDEGDHEFARGLVRYPHGELEKICGLRSQEIEKLFGRAADEAIHRDSLVILRG